MRIFYRVNTANGAVDLTEDVSGGLAAHKSRIEGIYGDRLVRFGVITPESVPTAPRAPRAPSVPSSSGSIGGVSSGAADAGFIIWILLGLVFVLYCFFSQLFNSDRGQDLETDLRVAGDLKDRCSSCSFCDSGHCDLYDLELVAPGETVCSSYN